MESAFLLNFGSNIATIGIGLAIYVTYKRCSNSKCAIHSQVLDCESDAIKEIKQQKAISLFKTAMGQYEQETNRLYKNGTAEQMGANRLEHPRNLQKYENDSEGTQV